VSRDGRFIFVLAWVDPGTLPFLINRITVVMKEDNKIIMDEEAIATNLFVAESLPKFLGSYSFDQQKGVVTVFPRVGNLAQKSQFVKDLKVHGCSFPTAGVATFLQNGKKVDPQGPFEIESKQDLVFQVEIPVPSGVIPQGIL